MKISSLFFVVAALLAGCLAACGGGKLSDSSADAKLPEGHPSASDTQPPPPESGLGSDAPTDRDRFPLKLEGSNSVEELKRGMEGTENAEARTLFAAGFRKTFSADASKRDYRGAAKDLESALEFDPNFAEAHRALGYARFNMGFDVAAALDFAESLQLESGGFHGAVWDEAHDVEYSFYGLGCLALLSK